MWARYQKQEESKAKDKYDGSGEVGVVHYALVDGAEGVEDGHGFGAYMREIYAELW